ncbi:hypothetical protein HYX01_04115 [Candidatus Woesearchaeota archaeon]|nr:hypothetical protein [Candidatus Woesearchaeota archaeon]
MKCEICGKHIKTTFMEKILGTYIKDSNGKKHAVCQECQKNLGNNKKKILENIKYSK